MKIQRLSTASFKVISPEGKSIMIDPWLTGDPLWPISERTSDKLKEIDIIAITHAHFDHASGIDEIVKINEKVSIIAQFEYALFLMDMGIKRIIPTNFGATVDYKGIKISMVPASHTFGYLDKSIKNQVVGEPCGYVIELENKKKIYFSGDTGLTADMKFVVADYFKPHVAVLPVTGEFSMNPHQAAYAANIIGCKWVIPAHDFPRHLSEAADPKAYEEFTRQFPVLNTYKTVEEFMELMKKEYPHIEVVYIPIGSSTEIVEH